MHFCFYFHIISLLLLFCVCVCCVLFCIHILLTKDHFMNGLIPRTLCAKRSTCFFPLIIRIDVSFIFFTTPHHHKTYDMRQHECARSSLHTLLSDWSLCFCFSLRRASISISDRCSNKICIWFHLNRNHNFFSSRLFFYFILHHSLELLRLNSTKSATHPYIFDRSPATLLCVLRRYVCRSKSVCVCVSWI